MYGYTDKLWVISYQISIWNVKGDITPALSCDGVFFFLFCIFIFFNQSGALLVRTMLQMDEIQKEGKYLHVLMFQTHNPLHAPSSIEPPNSRISEFIRSTISTNTVCKCH